jgi:PadR family transcriptional regulator PadR
MSGPVRVTGPLLDVLEALLRARNENAELHGWAIMKEAKRSGPTVYGVLDRLEDAGWITGRWEAQHPESNRPRRRFYQLTGVGAAAAHELLAARRPQALRHRPKPAPGPAFLGWLYGLLPGAGR